MFFQCVSHPSLRSFPCLLAGWVLLFPLFAQQQNTGQAVDAASKTQVAEALPVLINGNPKKRDIEETRKILLDNGKSVLLQSIDIRVKGLSNKALLRNRLGVKVGQEFANLTELRTVLDIGFNNLRSTGYFESGGIVYRLIRKDDNAIQSIRLEAEFQDVWTIYPIGYPSYSTANGYGLKSRLKWDNFLGFLGNVTFGLNVSEVRNGNYGLDLNGSVSSSTINITPDFGFSGSLDVARDARVGGANWKIGAGIGASLNIRALQFTGISMTYSFSNSSSATFGYIGEITTRPYFSTSFRHGFSLGKTRTTWSGVLREGYGMSISNSYSFDSDPENLSSLQAFALENVALDFSMTLGRAYFDIINFKGRIGVGKSFDFANGKYNTNGYNYDVSSYNRGKRSGAVKGNFIAFLNMDMAILVFSDSLLGDVLLEPFLDASWVNNANGFILESASLGSGFELIWIFHSLKFRFTFGFDMHEPELYTIAITTGFFF